ncbi:MAG: encapsulin-associated ferritin-like protein [Alphaproteobacteria bacterium]
MSDNLSLHESTDTLTPQTIDRHRAIASLMEELEAVDWYNQRVDAAGDTALRDILAHNRDEEMEHAVMIIEWLRRNNPTFHGFLQTYLYTSGSIVGREATQDEEMAPVGEPTSGCEQGLGIGSLREGGSQ